MPPPVFLELHADLPQQGPGSDAETLQALRMLPALGGESRILDAGCGPGRQTLVLARETEAEIVAVDLWQPFIDQCNRRARAAGLGGRVDARVEPMEQLDEPDGSFDLIWSEGAIYNLGFEEGLRTWRRLLRPGGHVVATEISWLVPEPSPEPAEFWATAYPGMGSIDANLAAARRAGYATVGHFALAEHSWWNGYYDELVTRLPRLREQRADDPAALCALAETQAEIDLYRRYSGEYGYVFYVLAAGEGG